MYRSKIILLVMLAVALGCTQTRTETVTETYQDSTLPAGTKKKLSLRFGNKTYVTEKVGPDPVVELGHGNFFNGKGLYVMSNDQQLTYKRSGNVVDIRGNGNVVTLAGEWSLISVSGHDNVVRVRATDTVILKGKSNTIQWKKMILQNNRLSIFDEGKDNTVVQVAE